MADRSPYDIAKETLKQLSLRKLIPSPDNYQALFHEVAGTRHVVNFPEEALRGIGRVLPGQTPAQQRLLAQFDTAVTQRSWVGVQAALVGLATQPLVATPAHIQDKTAISEDLMAELREQIARLVENILPMVGADDPRLQQQAEQLMHYARQPAAEAATLKLMLGNLSFRLSFASEDQLAIKSTLLALLHLLFTNIGELAVDDRWLKGQIDALVSASTPPLTLRRLDDVQARLKDVIFKQSEAKARAMEAQDEMKQMLAAFIDRLSTMTEHSGSYQGTIEHCARQLESAETLADITPVLQEAIQATRSMSIDTLHMRDELREMRERTEQADAALRRMQEELDRASSQARHDPLTGALNRKGLDETLKREIARARRQDTPMCVALLDLDNFKKLNDTLGHDTGDAALLHLVQVARSAIRPQDSLARYGGEEFLVVLPDTDQDKGVEVMKRLQRELTKKYFLKDNEKVLITFSAGVAQVGAEEDTAEAIKRADQAMYLAKRSGKNRVVAA
ncbi:GGDEF domain-containing protein [Curvibacter sp. RS43]|uniref:diguanylate cyclase n=1 Tax=Curvibacter microcysteis TaxID=3026419 RepID=A0ABT5MG46_9BURK|nr:MULTISPECIES: GGDEF domain-containing protein [unclassified Curvibacter]MDD0808764.1 GGDEF domain-containing protein [Curvibacter sp. RS43]MDD0815406.1 GGDEF domain-containing protein [Curvibacter sp. HBC28]